MDDIQIEPGVPMPPKAIRKYPWSAMAVGDSFFIACLPAHRGLQQARIYDALWKWRNHNPDRAGIKMTVRKVPHGIRVWREA